MTVTLYLIRGAVILAYAAALLIAPIFGPQAVLVVAIVGGGLTVWHLAASGAFDWIGNIAFAQQQEASRRDSLAKAQLKEATVKRLTHELHLAIQSQNDVAVGEVCKQFSAEDVFPAAIPLLEIALNDIDPCLRLCAVRGLRWGGIYEAKQSSYPSAKREPNKMPSDFLAGVLGDTQETTQLRVAASIAIGNANLDHARWQVLSSLRDPLPEVKAAGCHALGRLAAQVRANDPITQKQICEGSVLPLLAALGEPDARVRQEAAQALGECGDIRALRPLQELAADGGERQAVRQAATDAATKVKIAVGGQH